MSVKRDQRGLIFDNRLNWISFQRAVSTCVLCQVLTGELPTSADGNLASPAAVGAADAVLGAPRQEVARLAGVDQDVAVGWQVHPHHVSVGGAPGLLAGVSWRWSKRATGLVRAATAEHSEAIMREKKN